LTLICGELGVGELLKVAEQIVLLRRFDLVDDSD
jgi:hypothetical protein